MVLPFKVYDMIWYDVILWAVPYPLTLTGNNCHDNIQGFLNQEFFGPDALSLTLPTVSKHYQQCQSTERKNRLNAQVMIIPFCFRCSCGLFGYFAIMLSALDVDYLLVSHFVYVHQRMFVSSSRSNSVRQSADLPYNMPGYCKIVGITVSQKTSHFVICCNFNMPAPIIIKFGK